MDDDDEAPAAEEPSEAIPEPDEAWDDDPVDDATDEDLTSPEPVGDEPDEDEGPLETPDEDLPRDQGERWTGDDDPVEEPPDRDLTEDGGDAPDRGEEGPMDDGADELDALAPLDGDESEEPEEGASGPLLEPVAGVTLRRVPGALVVTHLALGADRLYAVGDGVRSAPLGFVDDAAEFAFEPLELPREELPLCIVEDASGALTVGCASGQVLQQDARSAPWAVVDAGAAGAVVELATDGSDWALRTDGGAARIGDGRYWTGLASDASVHGIVVDLLGPGPGSALLLVTAGPRAWVARSARSAEALVTFPEGCAPQVAVRRGDLWLVVDRRPGQRAWLSQDGGARWTRAEALDGATAATLVDTDDGAATALASLPEGDGAALVELPLSSAAPQAPRRLSTLGPSLSDEGPCRVHALLALDRAGRRVVAATETGVWLLER